jgi:CheY-like chemotaxis protein
MHILAVDDNRIHCYALRKLLEHSGHRVTEAHTGLQAIEIALQDQPAVVLLDINLPDITGYEVCARLKADTRTRRIPIIFHTATEATAVARTRAEAAGAMAFLTYPINPEHLLTVVTAAAVRTSMNS